MPPLSNINKIQNDIVSPFREGGGGDTIRYASMEPYITIGVNHTSHSDFGVSLLWSIRTRNLTNSPGDIR